VSAQPAFVVFPAIDLRAGQVVRLTEGDPSRQINYSSDPASMARRWIDAGAAWLHVVNLDGAFGQPGKPNDDALRAILAEAARTGTDVQFGGGLRTLEAIGRSTAGAQTGSESAWMHATDVSRFAGGRLTPPCWQSIQRAS
jgi:phosphoribosylformimino-5-aminoimidazole carboxamide ribonucleotide (ProFAR) isomerase